MFTTSSITADSKADLYAELLNQAQSLLSGEHDRIANAANLSALVFHALPDINWAGSTLGCREPDERFSPTKS